MQPVPPNPADTVYLLRLHHVDNGGCPVWRFELRTPDGWSRTFRDATELTQFLTQSTNNQPVSSDPRSTS